MARFQPTMVHPKSTILIVDDSKFARTLLRRILLEGGFTTIYEAEDPPSAMYAMRTKSPDVVLLDIDLAGELNGLQFLTVLKKDFPRAKVIMVSALEQKLIMEKSLAEEADAFVAKPYEKEQILLAVGMAIGYV